ncbi:Biotin carboxylase of acetyl-CoA carboxylase [Labilithrix luteola]|uniref:Biotin carboxylase n=1 Tax=Labilithrix luteola TaxID=1391654 RepID=A0A0K1Q6J1_9BACT|nr:acetyl-CoA carboxylase biotin carboxylase subunit [Labilithrix luteola]AKV01456.1 Biotin carboxylase of acetyl-CoA carboxylase [Labilithrix luteola]
MSAPPSSSAPWSQPPATPPFKKILIANRGEIALRVIRACRELGIATVAVHSEADARALHVRFADEAVCIGPGPSPRSYLHIPAIISAAEITGADAIHPGYGFLSENAEFARLCGKCGITFIGPTPEAMQAWGDKVTARMNAKRFGLPLLPGSEVLRNAEHALEEAKRIGFPIIMKASGGGGGRGMRIVRSESEVASNFAQATREAEVGFKNPDVYMEKFVERPKHIEFQVLADKHGGVWTLGERECSLQRRHQKVIEEAPSPAMTPELRQEIGEVIRRAVSDTGYTTLGTLEFIMDEDKRLYFLEMNTRVQVEHPVTEMVTGLDLVSLQIRAAAGEKLELPDTRPWNFRGHAIECRVNAEDPRTFAPWPGLITEYFPPGGTGIRVDSGVYGGWTVPQHYDSLLAKVIVHAPTRIEAITRMRRALDEFIVGGIRTNIELHKMLLEDPEVREGTMTTRTIERILAAPHL